MLFMLTSSAKAADWTWRTSSRASVRTDLSLQTGSWRISDGPFQTLQLCFHADKSSWLHYGSQHQCRNQLRYTIDSTLDTGWLRTERDLRI